MEKTEKKQVAEKYPAQVTFMEFLRKAVPAHVSLVDEISELLSISTDGAYRRMRSETALTFDEWITLSQHFKIPPPVMSTGESNKVMFAYQPMGASMDKFEKYLTRILNNMKAVQQFPGHRLTFAAENVPLVHYFGFKHLTAFKFYYWNYCILGAEELKSKKFEPESLTENMFKISQEIFDVYCNINAREIWTEDTITGVIRQIEFFWDSDRFRTAEDALLVCDELKRMVNNVASFAEVGKKYSSRFSGPDQSYQLYNSEVMIGNSTVFVEMGSIKSSYISYNTFSSMDTQDEAYCAEIERWVNNLIQKSILLSGQAEKQRGRFTRNIISSIEGLEKKIASR